MRAQLIGCVAMRAIARSTCGVVNATFDRGVYVGLGDDRLVFVGCDDIEAGPLVVRTNRATLGTVAVGEAARLNDGVLHIGTQVVVALREAEVWSPAPFPEPVPERIARGLAALEAAGQCESSRSTGPADQRLAALLTEIEATVVASDALFAEANWPEDLRGLGLGLTPSGDDMLVGVLVALHALGRADRLSALATRIARNLDEATTPISAAHLRAAMGGAANEPLHRVVNAVLDGAPDTMALTRSAVALMAVGQSSGQDALAGLLATLRATLMEQPVGAAHGRDCRRYCGA